MPFSTQDIHKVLLVDSNGDPLIVAGQDLATLAKQDTQIARLDTLITHNDGIEALLAKGQQTRANSFSVVQPSDATGANAPQIQGATPSAVLSGTAAALNADIIADMDVSAYRQMSVQLTGFGGATINVQFTVNGTDWISWFGFNGANSAPVTALQANGVYIFPIPPNARMRVRATAYTSGTIAGSVGLSATAINNAVVAQIYSASGSAINIGTPNSDSQSTSNQSLWAATFGHLFDGTTWNRNRNNNALTLLSSAARTTLTNSSDQINYNWRGFILTVDVSSAGTGSITPSIQVKDVISGNYTTVWAAAAALTTNGTRVYEIYPTALSAASFTEVVQMMVGRTWRLAMVHNNANAITYSASADMVL